MLPSRSIGVEDAVVFDAAVVVRGVVLERRVYLKPIGWEETTEPVAREVGNSTVGFVGEIVGHWSL